MQNVNAAKNLEGYTFVTRLGLLYGRERPPVFFVSHFVWCRFITVFTMEQTQNVSKEKIGCL